MITPDSLTIVRMLTFTAAGLISGCYAVLALLGATTSVLPDWFPPVAGGAAALVFFLTTLISGRTTTRAALDESYQSDSKTAATAGFWSALVIGTALWSTQTGGSLQLAITLTGAAAVFLLVQATLDLRGLRCA